MLAQNSQQIDIRHPPIVHHLLLTRRVHVVIHHHVAERLPRDLRFLE
jgi:hypothetical protein